MNGHGGTSRAQKDNNSGRSTPDDFTSESSSGNSQALVDRNGRQSRSLSRNIVHPYPRHGDSPTTSLELSRSSFHSRRELPEPHVYIDTVSGQFNLTPAQAMALHTQVDSGFHSDHRELLAHLDNRAYQLKMENLFDIVLQKLSSVGAKVENLQEQVNMVWAVNQAQRDKITALTKDAIFEPLHISYKQLGNRVKDAVRKDPVAVELKNMKDYPHRWTIVNKEISLRARLIRSQYRISLRDSVFGSKRHSLDETVQDLAEKYSMDGAVEITLYHRVRIAILRRFARENPELLDREEAEDEAEDGSEEHENLSEGRQGSGSAKGKKKRGGRNTGKGRVTRPRGIDWWSSVDKWFANRVLEWGEKLDSAGWQLYIAETLKEEDRQSSGLFRRTLVSFGSLIGSSNSRGGTPQTSPRMEPQGRLISGLRSFDEDGPEEDHGSFELIPSRRSGGVVALRSASSDRGRSTSPSFQIPSESNRAGAVTARNSTSPRGYSQRVSRSPSEVPPLPADTEEVDRIEQPRRLTLPDPRILAIQGHHSSSRDRFSRPNDGSRSTNEGVSYDGPSHQIHLPRILNYAPRYTGPAGAPPIDINERPIQGLILPQIAPQGEFDSRRYSPDGSSRLHDQQSGLSGGAQWMAGPAAGNRRSTDFRSVYHAGADRYGAVDGGGGGGDSWEGHSGQGEGRERGY